MPAVFNANKFQDVVNIQMNTEMAGELRQLLDEVDLNEDEIPMLALKRRLTEILDGHTKRAVRPRSINREPVPCHS